MIIIMRATVHDRAPNTYYGQRLGGNAAVCEPRTAGHCPSWGCCDRWIRDLRRLGTRFGRKSPAGAPEICRSTKKKTLSVRRSGARSSSLR